MCFTISFQSSNNNTKMFCVWATAQTVCAVAVNVNVLHCWRVSAALSFSRSRRNAWCERVCRVASLLRMAPSGRNLTLPAEVLMSNVTTFKFLSALNSKNKTVSPIRRMEIQECQCSPCFFLFFSGFESDSVLYWLTKSESSIWGRKKMIDALIRWR